jgi:hypothetical protein
MQGKSLLQPEHCSVCNIHVPSTFYLNSIHRRKTHLMDNMISNGLKTVIDLSRNEVLKKVCESIEDITYMNMFTGQVSLVDKTEPPISHILFDIGSMIQFLTNISLENASRTRIFIEPSMIVCILDYGDFRANTVRVPLTQSPILAFLSRTSTDEPKEAIRSLKYNLKSAISLPDPVPSLQTLKFESSSSAEHQNKTADEGVSRSLKSKVTGAAEIPEEFTVRFQMYPSIAMELPLNGDVEIKMELNVDPSEGTVSFRPFPGAADHAIVSGMAMVKEAIVESLKMAEREEEAQLVFLGKP